MRSAVLAVLLAASSAALACGYCVEDKIAAAYDHAVVVQALGRKHHVAFFHIDGSLAPGDGTKHALEMLVDATAGVDRGSARVSIETATLSFAFDPERAPLGLVHRGIERDRKSTRLNSSHSRASRMPSSA